MVLKLKKIKFFTVSIVSPSIYHEVMGPDGPDLPDVQAGFRNGRGTRDQIATIHWIIKKAREFQKNIYFCFIDYAKAFDCVDHNKLEYSSRRRNTRSPYLPPENMYAGQEATVGTEHGTIDWFQIGKGVPQGCILSHCLFSICAEYIM